MNLDIVKLFPNGCAQQGIVSRQLELSSILSFGTYERLGIGFMPQPYTVHVVVLTGGLGYSFIAGKDPKEYDPGIHILQGIADALNKREAWNRKMEAMRVNANPEDQVAYQNEEKAKARLAENFDVTEAQNIEATQFLEMCTTEYGYNNASKSVTGASPS